MSEFDPGDHSASIVSVTDQVRPLKIGMPVTSVHFLGDNAAFVGAEESVFLVSGEGEISPVAVHGGGILCAASDGERIVMGGDDGKLVELNAKGEVAVLAAAPSGVWVDGGGVHARVRRAAAHRQCLYPLSGDRKDLEAGIRG